MVGIRAATGLNQTEFCEQFGVSRGTYKNYERGAVDPPISLVAKICEKYEANANWLLLGKSKPSEDDLKKVSASIAFAFNYFEERDEPITASKLIRAVATILNVLDGSEPDFSAARPLLNTYFSEEM
jgi:transcriptional regulator with XRE-family HTH domain